MSNKAVKVLVDNKWYTLEGNFEGIEISSFIQKLIDSNVWHITKDEIYINPNRISGYKIEEEVDYRTHQEINTVLCGKFPVIE